MEVLLIMELGVPASQIATLLALSTGGLLFGKIKLALLFNYIFTLYWGFFLNRDLLLMTAGDSEYFAMVYFGSGLMVILLALMGFITQNR